MEISKRRRVEGGRECVRRATVEQNEKQNEQIFFLSYKVGREERKRQQTTESVSGGGKKRNKNKIPESPKVMQRNAAQNYDCVASTVKGEESLQIFMVLYTRALSIIPHRSSGWRFSSHVGPQLHFVLSSPKGNKKKEL